MNKILSIIANALVLMLCALFFTAMGCAIFLLVGLTANSICR